MPHSIRHRKALGKGLVSTRFGFQKTGSDVIQLFGKRSPIFLKTLPQLWKIRLSPRFSELVLPGWRQREAIDKASRNRLQKAIERSQADSAIFMAEEEAGDRVGFVHVNRNGLFSRQEAGVYP